MAHKIYLHLPGNSKAFGCSRKGCRLQTLLLKRCFLSAPQGVKTELMSLAIAGRIAMYSPRGRIILGVFICCFYYSFQKSTFLPLFLPPLSTPPRCGSLSRRHLHHGLCSSQSFCQFLLSHLYLLPRECFHLNISDRACLCLCAYVCVCVITSDCTYGTFREYKLPFIVHQYERPESLIM